MSIQNKRTSADAFHISAIWREHRLAYSYKAGNRRKPKVAKRSLRQLLKLFGIFLTRLEEEPEEELNGDLKH